MPRLPRNKLPAQQHEATDGTHTTEPFSILFDTPLPIDPLNGPTSGWVLRGAAWREQDLMWRRKIGFEVIARLFHDEKDPISPYCNHEHLTAIFDAGPREGPREGKRRNIECPMPSPAIATA